MEEYPVNTAEDCVASPHLNVFQAEAIGKHTIFNAGNTVWNRD